MEENKDLGIKIAENSDESFWTQRKEEIEQADKAERRNAKIREKMLELCNEELK